MDPRLRIVTTQPLQELWNERGLCPLVRQGWVSMDEIRCLLRAGPVQFVVANIGVPLDWIPLERCFDFWKGEALSHLADPVRAAPLSAFPDDYYYYASRWEAEGDSAVLLERFH